MTSLRDLRLAPSYRSDQGPLLTEFYIPNMARSTLYRRAVGYFSSYSLAIAAQGVAHLLSGGGRIQLVASPHLSDEDLQAIRNGYERRETVVERILNSSLRDVEVAFVRDRLEALAWLIAAGLLDIKIAVRVDAEGIPVRGLYHEKIGVFSDSEGNHVAFSGSPNETAGGLIDNFECIDVYWSWDDPQGRVAMKIRAFQALWSGTTAGLTVTEFPATSKDLLERFKRSAPPTKDPLEQAGAPMIRLPAEGSPQMPAGLSLRSHQLEAMRNWFAANGKGTLKMATGSGKTITALATLARLFERGRLQAAIVVVPYRHLVTQWEREAKRFGVSAILAFETRSRWEDFLETTLYNLRSGKCPFLLVITTNSTFSSDGFQRLLPTFPHASLIVADEAHNLGARRLVQTLPSGFPLRMALSATPERWFDDSGTQALFDYFGPIIQPEYTLQRAIQDQVLVSYRYFPLLVELTEEEGGEYRVLSEKIGRALAGTDVDDPDPGLTALLVRRARLLGTASNKMLALREVMQTRRDRTHMLFYCGDGSMEDEEGSFKRQIEAACKLLGQELQFRVATYTCETSTDERERLRDQLDLGVLQGLVAIRCLDEGLDIPSIRSAVILASSTNPRQFIQRRGRILRRSAGKTSAEIVDMIVVPPENTLSGATERGLMKREIGRVIEFARLASNAGEALRVVLPLQEKYGLLDM